MTDNERAIKIIKSECYISDLLDLDRTRMVNTALDMAVKALETPPVGDWEKYSDRLWKEAYERGKAEASVTPVSKWIPVSERMPEDDQMVLVSCKTLKGIRSVNRAYHMNGCWHGSGSMSGVVAWMPLPEPYREDDI